MPITPFGSAPYGGAFNGLRKRPKKSFVFWQEQLERAYQEQAFLQKVLKKKLPRHPKHGLYLKSVKHWYLLRQEEIRRKRRLRMLLSTKIPYYLERLNSFRKSRWDKILENANSDESPK